MGFSNSQESHPADLPTALTIADSIRHHNLPGAFTDSVAYAKEQSILSEGELATDIHIVVSGAVRLFKMMPDGRRQIIGFAFPGDMLGLSLDDRYLHSAEAISPVILRHMGRRQLAALLERDHGLRKALLAWTMTELQIAQDQMLLLGRKDATERLSSFLLTLLQRRNHSTEDRHLPLAMTRTDIADYLGLTMETVSRTISLLKGRRLIRPLADHSIELLNVPGLQDLAAGNAITVQLDPQRPAKA
ncbi:cyclic nucleotide-binding domain-containing protein [Nitrospirillum viridazoti]|uniref:CRP/FNR family transcriptional regulator n=1 Tax=Nitrospirillum amazonense TaxID=28077 RepID=A0A560HMB7_9PROT|nr:cyclic nucleotide-binding domain-containing protein [Nitrospirillum amazonense]TWB47673.1 CRP/FNR family transcriptional regulator [Nitrospirillum amazonense]